MADKAKVTANGFRLWSKVSQMKPRGELKGKTRYLFHVIALTQGKNDAAWCGNQYLQDLTGMSHYTFGTALRKLVSLGLIERSRKNKRQRTTVVEVMVDTWLATDPTHRGELVDPHNSADSVDDLLEPNGERPPSGHSEEAVEVASIGEPMLDDPDLLTDLFGASANAPDDDRSRKLAFYFSTTLANRHR